MNNQLRFTKHQILDYTRFEAFADDKWFLSLIGQRTLLEKWMWLLSKASCTSHLKLGLCGKEENQSVESAGAAFVKEPM